MAAQRAPRRLAAAGAGDRRLWLGVGLIVLAAVLGAVLLRDGRETVTVLRAPRDLSIGSTVDAAEPVEVDAALAAAYAAPGDPGTLRWPVAAGELVPRSAVRADADTGPTRRVTVPVDPLHAPAGLQAGDLVDVWATPSTPAGTSGTPRQVLDDVPVSAASADETGMSGQLAVAVDVPPERVAEVIAAARGGVVDLVAVPVTSQTPPQASATAAP